MYKDVHWGCIYIRPNILKIETTQYPPTTNSLSQLWFIHIMEYYETIKMELRSVFVDIEK